jgi:dihydropteroate synthase
MGVLNVTPDSFSDGGRLMSGGLVDVERVLAAAHRMIDEGAAILDVGGESTRPGSLPVALEDECSRVIPVIERLSGLDTIVSVDTSKPEVARLALQAGCHLVNDVTGLRDPGMLQAVADSEAAACIMHMRGEPRSMQNDPVYVDVVGEVRAFFEERVGVCDAAGIDRQRLLLDPGIGFGKRLEHNLALLRNLNAVRVAGLPVLVGVSRKSMLGALTERPVTDRDAASAVAAALAVEHGASVVRTHDVAMTADALKLVTAWFAQG